MRLFFALLLLSFNVQAQYIADVQEYQVLANLTIKVADTLHIGRASSTKRYEYIYKWQSFAGKRTYMEPNNSEPLVVTKIQKYGDGVNLLVLARAENSKGKWTVELVDAFTTGEIALPDGSTLREQPLGRWPYIEKDTLWLTKNAYLIKNSIVEIGSGSKPNGDFQYISVEYGAGMRVAGKKLIIVDLYASGTNLAGYKYIAKIAGDTKIYKCDVVNAANAGEIVVPGFISNKNTNSIADELLKLKKLKDEGVLTEQEFQDQKDKILNK